MESTTIRTTTTTITIPKSATMAPTPLILILFLRIKVLLICRESPAVRGRVSTHLWKGTDKCRVTQPSRDAWLCLKRGRSFGSSANSAFERKMRAPCARKRARSSGVKNEDPSRRGLYSRSRRPSGLRNRVRMSSIKNFQSDGSHSFHLSSAARSRR